MAKVQVESVEISVGKEHIRCSVADARALLDQLRDLFGQAEPIRQPTPPPYIIIERNHWPLWWRHEWQGPVFTCGTPAEPPSSATQVWCHAAQSVQDTAALPPG